MEINANSKYNWLLPLLLSILFITGGIVLLSILLVFDYSEKGIAGYVFVGILFVSSIIALFAFLLSWETVVLNEEGMKFRSLLMIHGAIKWDQIEKIRLIERKSFISAIGANTYHHYFEITSKIKSRQKFLKYTSPFYIIYNQKNLNIIKKCLAEYCGNMNIENLDQTISEKSSTKWFK